jgi:hypothetical protein
MKFTDAVQAKQIYKYLNIEEKLYKTNAVIWHNKTCKNESILFVDITQPYRNARYEKHKI